MSDIFLSYASEDRSIAKRIATLLEQHGWHVWWDRSIPIGMTFDEVLERALEETRCVVVLWSQVSIGSRWVKTEAAEGARRGILIPLIMEEVVPPLEFRRVQAADLNGWGGESDHPGVAQVIGAVAALLARKPEGTGDRTFGRRDLHDRESGLRDIATPSIVKAVPTDPQPAAPVRMTILRRGDMHLVDLAETDTLIPRSETRVDPCFIADITDEVERVAAGRGAGRGVPEAVSVDAPTMVADRAAELRAIGALIYSQLLTEPARRKISASPAGTDFYLRLDEQLVQIPWELCYDGHDFLATKFRVGRQVITERVLPRAGAIERVPSGTLEILVVADPTETLPAALEEAAAIDAQLARVPGVRVHRLAGSDIRRVPLLQALARNTIVHFAGHSTYDPLDPTRSGWVLRDGVLTAGEMAKLDRLPLLVFSNSCHAGATVGWDGASAYEGQAFGIGSAFLLAGVRNYIGTFWVAHDEESARFARAFYEALLRGEAIGQAMQAARRCIIEARGWNELTWASYMLYGDPAYRLPLQQARTDSTAGLVSSLPPAAPTRQRWWGYRRPFHAARAAAIGAVALALASSAGVGLYMTSQALRTAAPPSPPAPVASKPEPAPPEPKAQMPQLPTSYVHALDILHLPDFDDDVKVALMNRMAADRSDHAVTVLIAGARDISELVYMAAIRGLGGRPCHLVAPSLIALLDDEAWKRRAWAAKVLGDDRCREALRPLTEREERETESRVRDNLKIAIKQLAEEVGR